MLEGKNVNLRLMEKEDLPLLAGWLSSLEVLGEYEGMPQISISGLEKTFGTQDTHEMKDFMIEKKDGSKIGIMSHFYVLHPAIRQLEVGFVLVPNERGKGYCSEAANIMLDYLFLSRDTMRVQAITDVRNLSAQKVLEKAGFKKEGTIRKARYCRGEWADYYMYSILREEWKEPRILARSQ